MKPLNNSVFSKSTSFYEAVKAGFLSDKIVFQRPLLISQQRKVFSMSITIADRKVKNCHLVKSLKLKWSKTAVIANNLCNLIMTSGIFVRAAYYLVSIFTGELFHAIAFFETIESFDQISRRTVSQFK